MKKFTKEETMLMMLYNPGSREGLIRELAGMKVQLQPEEKRLAKLTDKVLRKLNRPQWASAKMSGKRSC